ncbi:hypothetical protein PFICI_14257 [Pestalotiopsis fici W106-1]|uniref:MARVEL domain-containing protein n=1 Tax=Pestalotiopsis fici (strain W106-1 / CGMCC3.15140) TaxID=1229662 RepID=W3WNJ7_PESFW|nr:uncharacterized protein PFICI_14257 [Pestalotiopsis fici W106-1]ETS74391.1 hypothetical protein PFICI_14257 [Pestalotiopsis fici W106-1]
MHTTATLADLVNNHSAPPAAAGGASSKWHRAKIVLRLLSLALAIAVATESILLLPIPVPITSPLFPLTLAVACISWDATILYTMRLQKSWISEALRMHIAIETLLWIIGLMATAMQMASVTIRRQNNPGTSTSGKDLALAATLCPLFILHFTLFIRACSESRRRKRGKQVQQLIRTLLQENERGISLSTLSPSSPYQQPPPVYESDPSYKMSPISELSTPTAVAELPSVIEPVELPGDFDYIGHMRVKD